MCQGRNRGKILWPCNPVWYRQSCPNLLENPSLAVNHIQLLMLALLNVIIWLHLISGCPNFIVYDLSINGKIEKKCRTDAIPYIYVFGQNIEVHLPIIFNTFLWHWRILVMGVLYSISTSVSWYVPFIENIGLKSHVIIWSAKDTLPHGYVFIWQAYLNQSWFDFSSFLKCYLKYLEFISNFLEINSSKCYHNNCTTVKPRVSGHLLPSKKCPDTRKCPDKRDSRIIVVHPSKYCRFRTQTSLWHTLKFDW